MGWSTRPHPLTVVRSTCRIGREELAMRRLWLPVRFGVTAMLPASAAADPGTHRKATEIAGQGTGIGCADDWALRYWRCAAMSRMCVLLKRVACIAAVTLLGFGLVGTTAYGDASPV